jgi:hypothetical protein
VIWFFVDALENGTEIEFDEIKQFNFKINKMVDEATNTRS